ncbi:carbon-nitrogen hydrolase [Leptodontidium sp. 2 PMI_412]|nr:carbon-nitrogen hydrolase [Leptodontidium sp. 2 PMI_412]
MVETKVGKDPEVPVKVAVVQAEPCWFDAESAVKKTCALIREAAAGNTQLIAFPELWIPGYPNFLWAHDHKTCVDYMRKYYRNAVELDSEQMLAIRGAAQEGKIMVILGYAERDRGSLFMSQTFIGPNGEVLRHRRKFKPTSWERVLFGDGTGDLVNNVVQTKLGRVGGLQCFEHLQPLLKYNTYAQGEQIHVASWPNLFPAVGEMPYFNTVEATKIASQMYAMEGSCFVLLASHIQTKLGLRANGLEIEGEVMEKSGDATPHTAVVGGGFSCVIGPDGRQLSEPVPADWEGIIFHDLDFNKIYLAKNVVDPVGHYSRPDIFTLQVRDTKHGYRAVEGKASSAVEGLEHDIVAELEEEVHV